MTSAPSPSVNRSEAVEALEAQLSRTPRTSRPYEHAVLSYRLGLAYAELGVGSHEQNLRKALACYDAAAAVFDPRFDPAEHARVLNAAGAAHRSLGDRRKAASLFEEAVRLLDGQDRDGERAAAFNNLGLVRSELGEPAEAVAAFNQAADLFDTTTDEGRRGWVAAVLNRGMAHAAMGTEAGLEAALADYDQARFDVDPEQTPYHFALLHHSVGTACMGLAQLGAAERERLLQEAIEAFTNSLEVFTRGTFPFQHALAKHNLGLAYLDLGELLAGTVPVNGPDDEDVAAARKAVLVAMRRGLACFEDSLAMLDPRVHAQLWRQAYGSLSRAEKRLEEIVPGATRAEHFAALAADLDQDDRLRLVRERLMRLLDQPPTTALQSALAEMAVASAKLDEDTAAAVIESELTALMELPNEFLQVILRARVEGTRQLPEEIRDAADRALDTAVGNALGGPQRVIVRDFLYELGWERP